METGHQAPKKQENPDQLVSNINNSNNPVRHEQASGGAAAGGQAARSYECTFCKRGFSNAQALGGHMNIHRKDKAKLNKHMTSNIETPPAPPPVAAIKHPTSLIMEAKSSEDDESSINWQFNVLDKSNKDDKTHVDQEIQKLNFLVQKSSSNQLHGTSKERFLSSSELDLELRLGPDPASQDYSSTGTKKFF